MLRTIGNGRVGSGICGPAAITKFRKHAIEVKMGTQDSIAFIFCLCCHVWVVRAGSRKRKVDAEAIQPKKVVFVFKSHLVYLRRESYM